MNIKYIIALNALITLAGTSCWGAAWDAADTEAPYKKNIGNPTANSPLLLAALYGNLDMIKQTLANGAYINTTDEQGNTPLRQAIDTNNVEAALMLIDNGADVNISNSDGSTPLMSAANNKNLIAVQTLLNSGADKDITNGVGETALDIALRRGDAAIINKLVTWIPPMGG